jgi:hypothetical protein
VARREAPIACKIAASIFPARKAVFCKIAPETLAAHRKTRKRAAHRRREGLRYGITRWGIFAIARRVLTRLLAITPRLTQRFIPASPLSVRKVGNGQHLYPNPKARLKHDIKRCD